MCLSVVLGQMVHFSWYVGIHVPWLLPFPIYDFIRSGTKHHSCYLQLLLHVGLVISCFKLLGLDLPVSRHCILNWELKKNAKTYFFKVLFCRISIFINYFFGYYCKQFFSNNALTTMFQSLLNPFYLLSPRNAHHLFLSLVGEQRSSSDKKKEKQTNTQRNNTKKQTE